MGTLLTPRFAPSALSSEGTWANISADQTFYHEQIYKCGLAINWKFRIFHLAKSFATTHQPIDADVLWLQAMWYMLCNPKTYMHICTYDNKTCHFMSLTAGYMKKFLMLILICRVWPGPKRLKVLTTFSINNQKMFVIGGRTWTETNKQQYLYEFAIIHTIGTHSLFQNQPVENTVFRIHSNNNWVNQGSQLLKMAGSQRTL